MARHVHIYLGWNAFTAEGERIFGKNQMEWRFQCPDCGAVARVKDLIPDAASSDLWSRVVATATCCESCDHSIGAILDVGKPKDEIALRFLRPHSARVVWAMKFYGDNKPHELDEPMFDFYQGDDPEWEGCDAK